MSFKQNGIEKFFDIVPDRKSDIFDVDSRINQSGDLKEVYGIDVIVKSLSTLFLTAKNTYFFDPDMGTGIYKYIFEPVDIATKSAIEQEINSSVARYENRADIKFNVQFFKNKKGFRINFMIDYDGLKKSVTVDIDETLLKTLNK